MKDVSVEGGGAGTRVQGFSAVQSKTNGELRNLILLLEDVK